MPAKATKSPAADLEVGIAQQSGCDTPKEGVRARLLIIDDEKDVHYSFKRLLESQPVEVLSALSGDEGLKLLKQQPVDVVVMDIRMGNQNGLEALKYIRQHNPRQVVVMMTAYGTSQTAIEAMKLGAYDYVLKPFDIPELKKLLERAIETAHALKETVAAPTRPSALVEGQQTIIGNSPAMQQVYKLIGQVAGTNATVLITGESGTGKEMVARAIHQNSTRSNRVFIPINCAAIPDNLLESELFGHERGSFTGAMAQRIGKFELADGGTIFLDEIGEMPVSTQSKILRVLQEREFSRLGNNEPLKTDVRLIAATNKNLTAAVAKGEFREDLFYRLNVVTISLPPLRERLTDVPLLVGYFLQKHRAKNPSGPLQMSESAIEVLCNYRWPGNVRELENVVQRAMVFATGATIYPVHLPAEVKSRGVEYGSGGGDELEGALRHVLDLVEAGATAKRWAVIEQRLVACAIERCGGEEGAAELLGLPVATVRKLNKGAA